MFQASAIIRRIPYSTVLIIRRQSPRGMNSKQFRLLHSDIEGLRGWFMGREDMFGKLYGSKSFLWRCQTADEILNVPLVCLLEVIKQITKRWMDL
jgi:hypothetical protein